MRFLIRKSDNEKKSPKDCDEKNPFYTKDIFQDSKKVEVGDFTYGNPKVKEWGEDTKLIIGKFCSISSDVVILLGGNHRVDWITTYPFPVLTHEWPTASNIKGHPATKGDVIIGNDVWIGYGATILSGIVIGDGAAIGARSVVAKNVEPYSIVAGNPAREIKKRFNDETIKKLLDLKWWNWELDKIKENINILCGNNLNSLFEI